jgi:hypothetical protein
MIKYFVENIIGYIAPLEKITLQELLLIQLPLDYPRVFELLISLKQERFYKVKVVDLLITVNKKRCL